MNFEEKQRFLQGLKTLDLAKDFLGLTDKIGELTKKVGEWRAELLSLRNDLEFWESKIWLEVMDSVMPDGKTKPTIADREAWRKVKLKETQEYMSIYSRAMFIETQLANDEATLAREEHRFTALKSILVLKAAQINFLSGKDD